LFTGIDLRAYGSGSTGTTNALRVYGWRISMAVLILDVAKGFGPVFVGRLLEMPDWAVGLTGVAAVVGHCWSPYIRFTGGKGMATGGGAVVAMNPWMLVLAPVMAVILAVSRYVSLGSVVLAALAPLLMTGAAAFGWTAWWYAVGTWAIGAIILYKHQGNIQRLLNGTERKIGQNVATGANPASPSSGQ
jgi:glycerol-3-phosphate acyltransferase PlsY